MEHQLLIGKFTLESLTSGLYVSPLDLYREYVQNAADSIDEALEQGILKKGEEKISITVSESEREHAIEWKPEEFGQFSKRS